MAVVTCPTCGAKNRVDERAATHRPICGKCGVPLDDRAEQVRTPIVVTDASFQRDVLQAGRRPVLIDCWAEWCGPCRMIAPMIDELAAESGGRYVVGKLNVDENPRTASQYRIESIPTLLIFKSGQLVDRVVGLRGKEELTGKLERQF